MKKIISVFSLLFLAISIYAQRVPDQERVAFIEDTYMNNLPVWLMMERGRESFELGELGLASRIFREIIDRNSISPDAEMWLGYIYEQEGEPLLAEKQYLKALENKNQLYILEDRFTLMYRLTEIYRVTSQYGKYEKILIDIIENDEGFNTNFRLFYAMTDVLNNRGVDKLFELYRYTDGKFNSARISLGIFYYQTGRYSEAELNLTVPFVSILSTGFEYLYEKRGDYEYTTVRDHISSMLADYILTEYMQENSFFRSAYYLAAALYAEGNLDVSNELWQIIKDYDSPESIWSIRSTRQLNSPFIEPLISPRT